MASRSHTFVLIAAVVAVGAIIAGCSSKTAGHASGPIPSSPTTSGGVTLGSSASSSASTPPPTPSATASPSATPSAATSAAPARPTVKGWQAVGDHVRKIAYDVPPSWKLLDPAAPLSAGSDQRLQMFAGSLYREGFCPAHSGSARATAGIASAFQGSLSQVAHTLARFFAREVYEKGATHARLTIGKPTPVKVAGAHAVEVRTVVTKDKGDSCGAPKAVVDVVAVSGGGSSGIFVLMADQGVPSAVSAHEIDVILGSVRRFPS